MTISPLPFPYSVCVCVNVSPIVYALFAGKLYGYAPPVFPEDMIQVRVFIDLPFGDPEEDTAWLAENYLWVKRRILDWLIAPVGLN